MTAEEFSGRKVGAATGQIQKANTTEAEAKKPVRLGAGTAVPCPYMENSDPYPTGKDVVSLHAHAYYVLTSLPVGIEVYCGTGRCLRSVVIGWGVR